MRSTTAFFLLGGLLLASSICRAQAGAAPSPGAPQTVLLRYQFTVGQTEHYDIDADIRGTMTGGAMSFAQTGSTTKSAPQPPMIILAHAHMRTHRTVASIDPADGAATLRVGIDSLSVSESGQIKTLSPDQLQAMSDLGTIVIKPDGAVVSTDIRTPPKSEGVSFDPDASFFTGPGALPDTPIGVGAKWNGKFNLGSSTAGPAGGPAQLYSTLSDVKPQAGGVDAEVDEVVRGLQNTAKQPISAGPFDYTSYVGGAGKLDFNTTAGDLDHWNASIGVGFSMDPTGKAAKASGEGMRLHMRIVLTEDRVIAAGALPAPAEK